jgi:predicted transcriptional regulator of viral defense system
MSDDLKDLVRLQAGVISRRQAPRHGLPTDVIDRLVRAGRWQALRRGVYLTNSGDPPRAAVLWAAVQYAGQGAALSHQTAAELYKITDRHDSRVHVTIPAHRRVTGDAGMIIHRSRRIAEAVHPTLQPPRTRVEETVLDLVEAAATFDAAVAVVSAACQRRLSTAERLATAMIRRKKMRWRIRLTEVLGAVGDGAHSLLEYRYPYLVERPHGLPRATRQARISSSGRNRYLDNLYGDYGLCVELDGMQAHPEDRRWQDLRRTNELAEHGLVTIRYGWADVENRPCETAVQIAAVLRTRGWPGRARACAPACAARRSAR